MQSVVAAGDFRWVNIVVEYTANYPYKSPTHALLCICIRNVCWKPGKEDQNLLESLISSPILHNLQSWRRCHASFTIHVANLWNHHGQSLFCKVAWGLPVGDWLSSPAIDWKSSQQHMMSVLAEACILKCDLISMYGCPPPQSCYTILDIKLVSGVQSVLLRLRKSDPHPAVHHDVLIGSVIGHEVMDISWACRCSTCSCYTVWSSLSVRKVVWGMCYPFQMIVRNRPYSNLASLKYIVPEIEHAGLP